MGIYIVGIVIVLILLWFMVTYNGFVRLKNTIEWKSCMELTQLTLRS